VRILNFWKKKRLTLEWQLKDLAIAEPGVSPRARGRLRDHIFLKRGRMHHRDFCFRLGRPTLPAPLNSERCKEADHRTYRTWAGQTFISGTGSFDQNPSRHIPRRGRPGPLAKGRSSERANQKRLASKINPFPTCASHRLSPRHLLALDTDGPISHRHVGRLQLFRIPALPLRSGFCLNDQRPPIESSSICRIDPALRPNDPIVLHLCDCLLPAYRKCTTQTNDNFVDRITTRRAKCIFNAGPREFRSNNLSLVCAYLSIAGSQTFAKVQNNRVRWPMPVPYTQARRFSIGAVNRQQARSKVRAEMKSLSSPDMSWG